MAAPLQLHRQAHAGGLREPLIGAAPGLPPETGERLQPDHRAVLQIEHRLIDHRQFHLPNHPRDPVVLKLPGEAFAALRSVDSGDLLAQLQVVAP